MHPVTEVFRNAATAPVEIVRAMWLHRDLIRQLTRRQIAGRYRGSYLGLLWSLLHPLLMLVVYTFVFGVIFHARWNTPEVSESRIGFALALFCGLIVYNVFAEVVGRSPGLILANPNYVKKVVFPLEILPVALLGEALFHGLMSLVILLAGVLLFLGRLTWHAAWLPVLALPLVCVTLGLGCFLAALGVFVRDVRNSIGVILTVLFFLTPIFYPVSAVPERVRIVLLINPLAVIVEGVRRVVLFDQLPDWPWLAFAMGISLVCLCFGFSLFQSLKRTFADVM